MSGATLNGITVTRCCVSLPAYGLWFADVECGSAEVQKGAATLVLEDATFKGTILTGGTMETRTRYRIVGGAGGWGKVIAPKPYTNDAGVKLSTVLTDAANACGEKLGAIPVGTVGSAFVRGEGPAARVLDAVSPRRWYVDEAGVTQIGARPKVAFTGAATRMRSDAAQGVIELAPATIATLVPGVLVDGLEAVDVEHVLDGKLRTTVWGKGISDTSRMSMALVRIVDAITARYRYSASWEYRVVQLLGERLELQTTRVSSGMPSLSAVRIRPGVAGMRTRPKLGSIVTVSFLNGDQARPFVSSFDDPESPGFIPDEIALMAGSTGGHPTEHATSAEALTLALQVLLTDLGAKLTAAGPPAAAAGAVFTTEATDAVFSLVLSAIQAASLSADMKTALDAVLAAKTNDNTGKNPGMGWPNVRGG